jgi:hypothetical protein
VCILQAWDDLWLGNWDKVDPSQYATKLDSVKSYRTKIRAVITALVNSADTVMSLPVEPSSVWWLLYMVRTSFIIL